MSRNPFGWSYPPGAENDPNAPYNQPDYDDYNIVKLDHGKQAIIESLCAECKDKGIEIPKQSDNDEDYIEYLLEILNDEGTDPGYKYGIDGEYYAYMIDPDYEPPEPDYDPEYD